MGRPNKKATHGSQAPCVALFIWQPQLLAGRRVGGCPIGLELTIRDFGQMCQVDRRLFLHVDRRMVRHRQIVTDLRRRQSLLRLAAPTITTALGVLFVEQLFAG